VSRKLLVLTERSLCPVLDEDHPVYSIKTVHAIPLSEERATVAVNALLSRNARNSRPSLFPLVGGDIGSEDSPAHPEASTRVVKFSDKDEIKVMTPVTTREHLAENDAICSPTSSSGRSTPNSETSQTGLIERTIASRLAFWNGSNNKGQPHDFSDSYPVEDQDPPLDTATAGNRKEPAQVLGDIIVATAPVPNTREETHNQLEDKIVRETIREFSKGGMYFAYSFGQDFEAYILSVC
jgi:phosphatidylinositol 4-phosphatase